MNLPTELIRLILDFLNLNELLICRLVCKKFHSVVNSIRIQNLTISAKSINHGNYFRTYEPFENDYLFIASNFNCFKTHLFKMLLINLKRLNLKIDFKTDANSLKTDIETLNQFEQLQQLELTIRIEEIGSESELPTNNELNLPNLKILNIENVNDLKLQLNTPNLRSIRCNSGIKSFSFSYPQLIEHFETSFYNLYVDIILRNFKNLKYLKFNYGALLIFEESVFSELINLEALHFLRACDFTVYPIFDLKEKLNLRFDIYVQGLRIDNKFLYREIFSRDGLIRSNILVENYSKLAPIITEETFFDYNYLLKQFNQLIPSDFFTRFLRINELLINGKVASQQNLVEFIKNCKSLNNLMIWYVSLDQLFYDQLFIFCPYLMGLEILEEKVPVNFKFTSNLSHLNRLIISNNIPYQAILTLFQELPNFKELHMNYLNGFFNVKIFSNHSLNYLIFTYEYRSYDSKSEMLKYLKKRIQI